MKSELKAVLDGHQNTGHYEAFDLFDEATEHELLRISFNADENPIKFGRILIQNRIRSFTVSFSKTNLTHQSIKLTVSQLDPQLQAPRKIKQYLMSGLNLSVTVSIDEAG